MSVDLNAAPLVSGDLNKAPLTSVDVNSSPLMSGDINEACDHKQRNNADDNAESNQKVFAYALHGGGRMA